MTTKLKCGCIPNAYWCSKHDIYTGNVPPWGAGQSRAKESQEVYQDEINWDAMDRAPEGCSCHISAPCGWCERTQNEHEPE